MNEISRVKAHRKRIPLARQGSTQIHGPQLALSGAIPENDRETVRQGHNRLGGFESDENHGCKTEAQLQELADEYFEILLPFFLNQREGSMIPNVKVEFSKKMEQKLGLSYLFERTIRLNLRHFSVHPSHLPYTLFHEMAHIWLYDCDYDPNHTWRFYRKMEEFSISGLPVDPFVHIHKRVTPEAKCVYSCPNCQNRWYLRATLRYPIYCGPCHDADGVEYYATLRKTEPLPTR